jgi:hypothetical protein
VDVHERLLEQGCDLVLGPYGSDTTRAIALARAGAVVWNHGAAADDVQRLPGVVSMTSPSSRYLVAVARAAVELYGVVRLAVFAAPGPFARLAREGLEREANALGVQLVSEREADCLLLCGPVEWEAKLFRALARRDVVFGGVSPGVPTATQEWPDGTLAPVQWHPELGGPPGLGDYVAAQAYAAGLIAERCLELDPEAPLSAARSLKTTTFFGGFELDETGLQTGHRLSVVRWRAGRQELLLPDAA